METWELRGVFWMFFFGWGGGLEFCGEVGSVGGLVGKGEAESLFMETLWVWRLELFFLGCFGCCEGVLEYFLWITMALRWSPRTLHKDKARLKSKNLSFSRI